MSWSGWLIYYVTQAGFQMIINNSYDPLLTALPLSLQDRTYTPPVIEAVPASVTEDVDEPRTSSSAGHEQEKEQLKPKDAMDEGAEATEESYGFAHPAASRPQRAVWIPRDTLGLSKSEARACREEGIAVGERHATMDAKGKVDVSGGPPDLIQ